MRRDLRRLCPPSHRVTNAIYGASILLPSALCLIASRLSTASGSAPCRPSCVRGMQKSTYAREHMSHDVTSGSSKSFGEGLCDSTAICVRERRDSANKLISYSTIHAYSDNPES